MKSFNSSISSCSQFIQPPGSPATEVIEFCLPQYCVPWIQAVTHYLRQNLLIFLHIPKYTDSNTVHHFKVKRGLFRWNVLFPAVSSKKFTLEEERYFREYFIAFGKSHECNMMSLMFWRRKMCQKSPKLWRLEWFKFLTEDKWLFFLYPDFNPFRSRGVSSIHTF